MLIILVFCFGIIFSVDCASFPNGLERCKFSDEECHARMANEVMKRGSKGFAELGLPVFDPLFVNKIGIDQGGNGPVVLKLEMRNTSIYGFSGVRIKSVKGFGKNIDRAKIDIRYSQPLFQMIGRYIANGKVLILPVHGDGNANITMVNTESHLKMLTKRVEKNGRTFMQIDKMRLNFKMQDAHMEFGNLFNGNKQLSDTFNLFLADNWRDVFAEIKPAMAESIASVYKPILNNLFGNIPYDELFSE